MVWKTNFDTANYSEVLGSQEHQCRTDIDAPPVSNIKKHSKVPLKPVESPQKVF